MNIIGSERLVMGIVYTYLSDLYSCQNIRLTPMVVLEKSMGLLYDWGPESILGVVVVELGF